MSRKSLIICLATLAAMLVALGVAIAFLYSGTDGGKSVKVSYSGPLGCLSAVPSDAALVSCFKRSDIACNDVLRGVKLADSLASEMERGSLESLRKSPMSLSLHYSGKLIPLFVWDMSNVSEQTAADFSEKLAEMGQHAERKDAYLVASESETLVRSALRHMECELSIADAQGFAEAAESVSGDNLLFVSHLHARKLMSAMFSKTISRYDWFAERAADWSAFTISSGDGAAYALKGAFMYDSDADEFMTVLEDCTPAVSVVADMLPSYTMFALTLPLRNFGEYAQAYQSFVDSRQRLQAFKSVQQS